MNCKNNGHGNGGKGTRKKKSSDMVLAAMHPAIIAMVLLVIAMALAVILSQCSSKDEGTGGDDGYVQVNLELPDPMVVEDPLMKDFIDGSFGYRYSYNVLDLDPFFLVCYKPDDPRKMWVSYYSWGEQIMEPPLGTDPNQNAYELSSAEQEALALQVEGMDQSHSLDADDGWRILVVQSYVSGDESNGVNQYDRLDSAGRFAGIDMQGQFGNMTLYGNMYKDVYVDGYGWPTDYLRKEPFCNIEAMKQWNMSDEFWDEYRLHQVLEFYLPGADEETDVPLKAEVTYIDTFKVVEPGKQPLELHRHQLDILLESRGYVDHVEEDGSELNQISEDGANSQ